MLSLSASTAVRSRAIAATPAAVWEIVDDPHHQPRWWPGVERVEGVGDGRFTQVMRTKRGRPVRIDFATVRHEAPSLLVWRQEVAGTPFARVLERSLITLELAPEAEVTTVTITQEQKLRGSSRGGGLIVRRATGKRLAEALAGLAAVSERPTGR